MATIEVPLKTPVLIGGQQLRHQLRFAHVTSFKVSQGLIRIEYETVPD